MKGTGIYDVVANITKRIVSQFSSADITLSPDSYFCQLGISSCDRAEIVAELMESLQLKLPLESLLAANTLGELAELVAARQSATA